MSDALQERMLRAIQETGVTGLAAEEGARLLDHWTSQYETFPERNWRVVATESPFYIQLDEKTYIGGMMDATFEDEAGLLSGEWKTRREPKKKKDGTNYAGDDEDGWLGEISGGPQLGVYALAAHEGSFFVQASDTEIEEGLTPWTPHIAAPRILVRAAIKSTPAEIWPSDWRKGLFTFPQEVLGSVRSALVSAAVMIRAGRKAGVAPWAVPGIHCTNMYRKVCPHLEPVCSKRLHPSAEPVGGKWLRDDETDPGFVIVKLLGLDPFDPELIVLSQSALTNYYWCMEKGRIDGGGYFGREEDFNLNVGTVLHAGLACWYREIGAQRVTAADIP
jgi:hypothetical protein